MASLDDVVDAINSLRDVLEEIRDGGTGGGGEGVAGSGQAGRASKGGGVSDALLGGLGSAKSILGTANSLSQATGISAGLNARALGATGDQAVGIGVSKLARTATELPFGDVLFANTANTLDPLERSEKSVSDLASQVARSGGELSAEGVTNLLKRQNEIEGRVQSAQNTVKNIQGGLTKDKVSEALSSEASEGTTLFAGGVAGSILGDEIKAVVKGLADAIKEATNSVRGVH